MMKIEIDMEMPKNCNDCRFCIDDIDEDYQCCINERYSYFKSELYNYCPLNECEVKDEQ